jgi:hypothetical protein
MHLIKYNSWQVLNSYVFLHCGTILREFFITKECKSDTLIWVLASLLLEWLKYWNFNLNFTCVNLIKIKLSAVILELRDSEPFHASIRSCLYPVWSISTPPDTTHFTHTVHLNEISSAHVRLRQMFLCVPHTQYRNLRTYTWNGSL